MSAMDPGHYAQRPDAAGGRPGPRHEAGSEPSGPGPARGSNPGSNAPGTPGKQHGVRPRAIDAAGAARGQSDQQPVQVR